MSRTPRTIADVLGRTSELRLERIEGASAILSLGAGRESVLLPESEVPRRASPGQMLSVFVYLDSDERPVATTREPKLELDEVAFLEATALTEFGAFVDWGLPKDLLVPFAKQTKELTVG